MQLLIQNKRHTLTETMALWGGCTWQEALSISEFHILADREDGAASEASLVSLLCSPKPHTHTHTHTQIHLLTQPPLRRTNTHKCAHTRLRADVRQKQTVESYSSITSHTHCCPAWHTDVERQRGVCDEMNESVWASHCSYINWLWRPFSPPPFVSISSSYTQDRQNTIGRPWARLQLRCKSNI